MDESVKVILKKLDEIDNRLAHLESPLLTSQVNGAKSDVKVVRDPLFHKAVEAMDKLDEISSVELTKLLKIDAKRADAILDQMEAAGLGTCYTKEV